MASISNYLRSAILRHCLGISALPKPARLYYALFTSPTDDENGGTELTVASMPRTGVDVSDASFSYSGGIVRNSNAIVFAKVATQTFGFATHFGIYDAPTGGNRFFHGQLNLPAVVNDNFALAFQANALAVRFNGGTSGMTDYLRDSIVAHIFRSAELAMPSPFLGIFQLSPTASGSQSNELGISGPRSSVAGQISVANAGASNPENISLPVPTQVISAAHFGILDAGASGNMMFFGPVTVPLITNASSPGPICPAGALHISLS